MYATAIEARLWCFAACILLCFHSNGQSAKKMNSLILTGPGYGFGVKEPDGWHGDTDKIAGKYEVNVVFLPSDEQSRSDDVTIRVRVSGKEDENTIEDLNYDMAGYKKQFPTAQFSDLIVSHPIFKSLARTVFVPNQFYEYVTYLNPGTGIKFILSVAMSKRGRPATDSELKAYHSVITSLVWLSGKG